MRRLISKQTSTVNIDIENEINDLSKPDTYLRANTQSIKHLTLNLSPLQSFDNQSVSLASTDNKANKFDQDPVENAKILERNKMLKMTSAKFIKQSSILNKSDQSETSNCPICLESLKKKFSVKFKCKRHFGHTDCIEYYYMNLDEPVSCPFNCIERH